MKIFFLLLLLLVIGVNTSFNSISFAKQLYIPGQYFSLMNFTKNTTSQIDEIYNIKADYYLGQSAYGSQGNSVYDFLSFEGEKYKTYEPCYYSAILYLNQLYSQYQPCQGGCIFEGNISLGQNATYISFEQSANLSLIVDNTFYPCNQGAYQSEIYLYQVINLSIESNEDYLLTLKIVFVILLQVFIFLFAYIMIMFQKLQNKRKKLKKIKQEEEDVEVLECLERDREKN